MTKSCVKELLGFNEAEAHAPRIHILLKVILPAEMRFNEAEAHAPRILWVIGWEPGTLWSFNEAEAHAPRIHVFAIRIS